MSVNHPYDGDLHMLVEEPREAKREHLLFLRWLAERGQLEHSVAGSTATGVGQTSWTAANESRPPPRQASAYHEKEAAMRAMCEITSDGDVVDDGETYALFSFDPEALSNDPIE